LYIIPVTFLSADKDFFFKQNTGYPVEQFIEFIAAHWWLVGIFMVLLVLFVFNEVNRGGAALSPQQLVHLVNRNQALVLDIRDPGEFRGGHIQSAVNIPFSSLAERLAELEENKDKPVVITCKLGQHSSLAGAMLRKAGFADVRRLAGGLAAWQGERLPLVKA